jgi:hypothetical protein
MARFTPPDFNDRVAAAKAAKEKALEKLRNKPPIDPAIVAERQAAQAARDAAAAEKRAARAAAMEAAAAEKEARKLAKAASAAAASKRTQKTEAELKAERDARYAARKARKR